MEKVQPKLLNQRPSAYKEQTGLMWDIREDENLDNYFKLTEAHIREYRKAEIFHTIGLAKRILCISNTHTVNILPVLFRNTAEKAFLNKCHSY